MSKKSTVVRVESPSASPEDGNAAAILSLAQAVRLSVLAFRKVYPGSLSDELVVAVERHLHDVEQAGKVS